jgi:hypothetical protein
VAEREAELAKVAEEEAQARSTGSGPQEPEAPNEAPNDAPPR